MLFNRKTPFVLILTCLMLTSLSSCDKDSFFLPTEKKIQGTWKYEKVEFQRVFSFSKKNLTSDYSDLRIEFKNDNSIVQTSSIQNREAIGSWDIDRLYSSITEDVNTTTELLKGHLTNVSTGYKTKYEWENLQVTRKRMSFTERRDKGIYHFKLRKQ